VPKNWAVKLLPRYIVPFCIEKVMDTDNCLLALSESMKKHGIHLMFYTSLLRPYVHGDNILFPGRDLDTI
ncbi:hypothetical protein DACRYDRAFT_53888, partial [Dacryopinax primogenitus]